MSEKSKLSEKSNSSAKGSITKSVASVTKETKTRQPIATLPAYCGFQHTVACFCPCVVMGSIRTRTAREIPFRMTQNKCCSRYPIGEKGCNKCCYISFLSLGWPIAPMLACYLYKERKILKLFYDDEKGLDPVVFPKSFYTCCLWPCNLVEQVDFINKVDEKGMLTFDWDLDLYKDQLLPKPSHSSRKVFIIGSDFTGKTEFFKKAVTYCDADYTIKGDTGTMMDSNKVQIGLKSFLMLSKDIRFLEMWNIPANEINTTGVKMFLPEAYAVIFVYDSSDGDTTSFEEMQELFEKTKHLHPSKKICIGVNSNPISGYTTYERDDDEMALDYLAKDWAVSSGCQFIDMSIYKNIDFHALNKSFLLLMI